VGGRRRPGQRRASRPAALGRACRAVRGDRDQRAEVLAARRRAAPDVAAAYEAAQDRAARQILAWLGEHASTRVSPRGQQVAVSVEKLEAVIRHYTSRARDPHRHLHVQINARVFAAGKWRGLDTVAVRESELKHRLLIEADEARASRAAPRYRADVSNDEASARMG
jgi:hypothetical protein